MPRVVPEVFGDECRYQRNEPTELDVPQTLAAKFLDFLQLRKLCVYECLTNAVTRSTLGV